MSVWEKYIGHPTLKVRKTANNLLVLTQKHPDSTSNHLHIPVNFASKLSPDFESTSPDFWISEETMSLSVGDTTKNWDSDSWVVFNIQRTGYYRVEYDQGLMNLIIQAMKEDLNQIHVINRAQIIDDLFYSMKESSGVGSYLELLTYLSLEAEVLPWIEAQKGFDFLHSMLFKTPVHMELMEFFSKIAGKSYEERESRSEELKAIIKHFSCKAELHECLVDASRNLHETPISKDHVYDLCFAFKFEDDESLNQFYEQSKISVEADKRISILKGLSCSAKMGFLRELLEHVVSSDNLLDEGEIFEILEFAFRENPMSLELAVDVLMELDGSR
jgi:hypothetical protein